MAMMPVDLPLEQEPASKRPKFLENIEPSPIHQSSPIPPENSPTPPPSTSADSKSATAAPKKKPASRSKKIVDPTAPSPSSTAKKTESTVSSSQTPLRADNKAKLEAMGLTWILPRYQPYPSQHPFKMGWSKPNSSNRLQLHHELACNPRGYTLTRSTYPTQAGKWYYEILVTSAPDLLERLENANSQPVTSVSATKEPTVESTASMQSIEPTLTISDAANPIDPLAPPPMDPSVVVLESLLVPSPLMQVEVPLPPTGPIFPDLDLSLYTSASSVLTEMGHVLGPYKVILPPPRWRLGWATEQADSEAPVGTDAYGFSWRDDGTLFHQARPIPKFIAQNRSGEPLDEGIKFVTKPDLELLEDLPTPDAEPLLESYTTGDVLGFAIELPANNFTFIHDLHAHQETTLVNQNTELQLRRDIQLKQAALNYPQANQALLRTEIEALTVQLNEIKPVPPLTLPASELGTRMTFYKNGKLQNVAIINLPPGSYYPAASLYYQAGAIANFGPTFAHPPPTGFLPASQLPDYYQIPLPESLHFPQPPQ